MRLLLMILVILVVLLYYLFPFIQVVGTSMYPTYCDQEIIFGTKLYLKSKLKKGDVVVYRTPTDNKIVIKRIVKMKKERGVLYLFCKGDNREHSYDSRNYGYISSKALVCKVINQRGRKIDNPL